jgi:undecaprenol kinase
MKNRTFSVRLGFAVAGIVEVWKRERSFRTQTVFALAASLVVALVQPGWVWAALIALSVAFVLALELLNSALEYLIDRVHPSIHPDIGRAKDAAAGAVLIASFCALIVGACMLAATVRF